MKICYHCMQQISNEKAHTCPQCGQSLDAARQAERFLEPGTLLGGKFLAGFPLGAGGFGNTYIGWDNLLFRKVAIKEFYPEQYCIRGQDGKAVTVSDERLQARFAKGLQQFLEEARRVAALHEVQGVVEISNFFEENGTGYIVMEYLEGMDIKTILKKSGEKKDYEWSRRVVLAVLYTLKEVHRRGVIHRDIAPDNIFVTKEGIIKLIDFGAAKHASAETTTDIMLKTGYAPIEQYGRTMEQGPYTDLYAVAALFYRMLTGQKPIPANERMQKDGLIPPSQMGVSLPEQAELAIMVCLNIMPQYRLQSAVEFMEALDGKFFIPVYEPEWILPPVEEKKGLWGKITSLPVAAKAALCLLSICIIGAAVFGTITVVQNTNTAGLTEVGKNGAFTMEDYSGQSYEEVEQKLKRRGIENIASPEYVLDGKPEGTILRQNISPSGTVSKEDAILFTVSGGDKYYTMPDFSGANVKDVMGYFTEKNFDIDIYFNPCDRDLVNVEEGKNESLEKKKGIISVEYCFSDEFENGVCFEQSVKPNEKCSVDKVATLSVSVGKEEDYDITVPDFRGMKQEEAEALIESCGLGKFMDVQIVETGETRYTDDKTEEEGIYVERQSIQPGKKVNCYRNFFEKLQLELAEVKTRSKSTPKRMAPQESKPEQTPPEQMPPEQVPPPVEPENNNERILN
ncbi:MAG: PASTA domain-containing protein [Eubacterium sp.]|jgi:serine/threonine protein kinase|nr:PASTA domain-containing protein [Eubacterium sp.]